MAVKTFTTGEVLTSTDTNTYLANAGLVFVKSQPVGTAVTSVSVTGAFNSDYRDYLISYSGGVKSADNNIRLALGGSATSYYGVLSYGSFLGGPIQNSAQNNAALFGFIGGGNSSVANIHATIKQPFLAAPTEVYSQARYGTVYGYFLGYHGEIASYSSFTITPDSGTFTGGSIVVYGYRIG